MTMQSCQVSLEPATMSLQTRGLYFPYIDVLRAVAIILVLIYHLIIIMDWKSFPSAGILGLFRIGWIGVELFFVISGFVISLSLLRCIEKFGIDNYRKPYFKNRLSRIIPLYFLTSWCFLVLVKPQLFNSPADQLFKNIISHIFFVHNILPAYATALNGPTWSIAVEMQFYIFMALVFKWLLVHRPILVCSLFIMTALVWRTVVWYAFGSSINDWGVYMLTQQLPGTFDAFGLGCAIALIASNSQHVLHRYLQNNWKNSILWLVVAIVLSAASFTILLPHGSAWWKSAGMMIFFRLLLAIIFMAWVCFVISLRNTRFLIKIFSPLTYIGKISYGIYLWHVLVIFSGDISRTRN